MARDQPQSKRRRLDAAAALSKPFKSPLRTRVGPSHPPTSTPDTTTSPKEEPYAASSPTISNADSNILASSPRIPAIDAHDFTNPPKLAAPKRSPLSDPEILDLQKQQRSLQSRLPTLRAELDTVRQALRIESSSQDAELEGLIIKWRLVSQEAADEVFAGAQERVARMGGMAAWRDRSKQDATRWQFEDEGQEHGDEESAEDGTRGPSQVLRDENDSSIQQGEETQDEVRACFWCF